jgi:hypothetical protein
LEAIPQRRPYLLIIRLRRQPQYCQDDIEKIKGVLPACTRAVWFDDKVIGLATMTELTPHEILQDFARELRPFETIGVYELGRLSASTDGASDPFNLWMDCNVRRGARRQSDDAEDVLKKKWGKRRVEHSEHGSVADTIRKVFSGTWPRQNGAKGDGDPD